MKRILITLIVLSIALTSFSQAVIKQNSYYVSIENAIDTILNNNTNVGDYDYFEFYHKNGKISAIIMLSDKDGYFVDLVVLSKVPKYSPKYSYWKPKKLHFEKDRKILYKIVALDNKNYKWDMSDGTYITIRFDDDKGNDYVIKDHTDEKTYLFSASY